MQHKNDKIPKHLSIPLDLAFHQPYHSIHIQETSIIFPNNHKENSKRIYISDYPTIDNHLFDKLFQQSQYSTQTHIQQQNQNQNQNKTRKTQKKKPN